jgi:hypothetical protein
VDFKQEDDIPFFAADIISGGGALYELTTKHETLESVFIQYAAEDPLTDDSGKHEPM